MLKGLLKQKEINASRTYTVCLKIEIHEIHRLYEIHVGSPRTNKPRPNCFVIDIMCLLFSVAFNKRVSRLLIVGL